MLWNPEFIDVESGIHRHGIPNPQRGIRNPRLSWITLHGAKWQWRDIGKSSWNITQRKEDSMKGKQFCCLNSMITEKKLHPRQTLRRKQAFQNKLIGKNSSWSSPILQIARKKLLPTKERKNRKSSAQEIQFNHVFGSIIKSLKIPFKKEGNKWQNRCFFSLFERPFYDLKFFLFSISP